MIKRESYLSKIRPFIDKCELIKVIVGVRRSGKSVMLELIKDELTCKGVKPEQMISINFEDLTYSHLTNGVALHDHLKEKIDAVGARAYVFLDEIQEVSEWERCVNSLRVNSDVDIYITGSNAKMLSGEYATLLSGRYVEFTVYPFSFAEYCEARRTDGYEISTRDLFVEYVEYGGLPFLAASDFDIRVMLTP